MFGQFHKKITIKSLTLREMPAYQDQYRRPYVTKLDSQLSEMIQQFLTNEQYDAVSAAPWIGQFLSCSAPVPSIEIPGGWGKKRESFVLHAQVEYSIGAVVDFAIAGYTTGLEESDDETWFVINSISAWRTSKMMDSLLRPAEGQEVSIRISNDHLLSDLHGSPAKEKDITLRPADLFAYMETTGWDYFPNDVVDTRALLTYLPRFSQRTDNIASNYYETVMRAYKNASLSVDFGVIDEEILAAARGMVASTTAMQNPFLQVISMAEGAPPSAAFSFKALKRIDPDVEKMTRRIPYASHARKLEAGGVQVSDWGKSDLTTAVASVLVQAIPALMTDLGITEMSFGYDNSRAELDFFENNSKPTTGMFGKEVTQEAKVLFRLRLLKEVMPSLTYGNMLSIRFEIDCDAYGETCISLRVGNDEQKTFIAPSFADATFAPMTATPKEDKKEDNLRIMAEDMAALLTSIPKP